MTTPDDAMTKGDRTELAKVVRMRARVAKTSVAQRQAELLAEVEQQLSAVYMFDDAAWADVTREAQRAIAEADAAVAERCKELGIPERFRPSVNLAWYGRGENALKERRTELRKRAQTRIDADGKAAKAAIEAREAEVLTEIIAGGLESADARRFLESIPTPAQLMPTITLAELEGNAAPRRESVGGGAR